MRRALSYIWNTAIDTIGVCFGIVARVGVTRGWLYFPFLCDLLSLAPFSFGWKLRRAVYSCLLSHIGKDAILHFGVILEDPRTTIGSDVWISSGCYIDYAHIGDSVLIGPQAVLLAGGRHHRFEDLDVPIKQQGNPPKQPLRIDHGTWIGANATVMANVGHDAIVGAGSVVTRHVPPYAVVAGNPARILRMRDGTNPPMMTEGKNARGAGEVR